MSMHLHIMRVCALASAMATAAMAFNGSPVWAADETVPAGGPIPASLEPGKVYPVRATAYNRGARLSVLNASAVDEYAGRRATAGRKLLVLATEWENVIPWTAVRDRNVPTAYKVPNLGDHLYVVVDGARLARLAVTDNGLAGHLPVRDLTIEKIGDTLRGNAVFEVPAGPIASLDLRFYDFAHGHMAVPIKAGAATAPKPIGRTQTNQVLELGIYGLEKSAKLEDRAAPADMTFVTVDLRARSVFEVETDAGLFDPKAGKGAKSRIGTVADWKESRKYLRLVVDGEKDYPCEADLTGLAEEPRFLPDVMTGGRAVFLVPDKAASIDVQADFPNAKNTLNASLFRPRGMTLPVESRRPALPKREALATVDDDMFKVAIVGQAVAAKVGGLKPKDGKFVLLDVQVANTGKLGEFFQTKQQLKLVTESAQQLTVSDATAATTSRPADLVWIPSGERRTFQVAFDVPAALAKPRLAYQGVSLAKTLDLPPIGPAGDGRVDADAKPIPATKPAVANLPPAAVNPPAMKPPTVKPPAAVTPVTPAKKAEAKLPARVAARPPAATAHGLAVAGLKTEDVNASIEMGAKFLWKTVKPQIDDRRGNPTREHVLYLLALVHAGYDKKDPACEAAVRDLLASADVPGLGIYGAGLYCMLAESFGDAMYLPNVRVAARYLIESQGKGGTWGYVGNRDQKLFKKPEPDLSQALQVVGGVPLEGPGSDQEVMARISKREAGEDGDNSVTQYAVLGLHSASRMGLKIPQETWQRAYDAVKGWQQDDGGWGYHGDRAYGSMVCAGIGTLTLCRHHLGEAAPAVDPVIEQGLGWLDQKFSVSQNPEYGDTWLYYYLYGLERVGRILDTEHVGDHEWYPFGAKFIVSRQNADGGWVHTGQEADAPLPTSFALLFLTRATPNLTIAKRSGPGVLRTEVAAPPINRVYVILDASGSMLEEMKGKQKFALAQEAVTALINTLPENTEVAVRAYGHRKRSIEEDADKDTQLVVPMAKLDKAKLSTTIAALRCRGKTPMALSLKQAAEDLRSLADKNHPLTVVLLTDGGEDTIPRQDPVKASAELAKLPGVSFQLVGFDINRKDWSDQLLAMAKAGGGQYLAATDGTVLLNRLEAAVYRKPDAFTVTDAAGKAVARGGFGQSVKLPAGKYTVSTSLAGVPFARQVWVNAESTTVARFDAVKVDTRTAGGTTPIPPAAAAPPAANVPPTTAGRKFCAECGGPLVAGAKFCPKCGKKVQP